MARTHNPATWGLALAVALAAATAGEAVAQSPLAPGETRGELTASDDRMHDGSYRDCHVLTVAPGSEVTLTQASTAFDSYLIAAVGSDCATSAVSWYANDDARDGSLDAALRFRAIAPSYVVLANSAGPGETGPYLLTTRVVRPDRIDPAVALSLSLPEVQINNLYASDDPFDLDDLASLRRWFAPITARALNQLQQRTDGLGLGFDFLVDGQDSELSNFIFSLHPGPRPDQPVVRAEFLNFDTPVRLDFVMTAGEASWEIVDIQSFTTDGRRKWSLTTRLAEELYPTPGR